MSTANTESNPTPWRYSAINACFVDASGNKVTNAAIEIRLLRAESMENIVRRLDNQDSAFPEPHLNKSGMSLRDYFAAKAMEAIISKSPFLAKPEDYEYYDKTAIGAYDYADAMLAARRGAS